MCFWKCLAAGWLDSPHFFPLVRLIVATHVTEMPEKEWEEYQCTITKSDIPRSLHQQLFDGDSLVRDKFVTAIQDYSSTRASGTLLESNNSLMQLVSNVTGLGIAIINVVSKENLALSLIKPRSGVPAGWVLLRQQGEEHFKLIVPTGSDGDQTGECVMLISCLDLECRSRMSCRGAPSNHGMVFVFEILKAQRCLSTTQWWV